MRAALAANSSATIGLHLDVEGAEFEIMRALVATPALLCAVSYIFVETHDLHVNLTEYGMAEHLPATIKDDVHRRVRFDDTHTVPFSSSTTL